MSGGSDQVTQAQAGGQVYTAFLKEDLIEERARKTSIEQRGLSVITTSGTLVTLLFALAAVVTKSQTYVPPHSARIALIIALGLFLIAALGGIVTNWPLGYGEADPDDLRDRVASSWAEPIAEAEKLAAAARAAIIQKARQLNKLKARALIGAMIAEVLAVVSVAIGVALLLLEY